MDADGVTFATISGNTREVTRHTFSFNFSEMTIPGLPSTLRFHRRHEEKKNKRIRQTAELALKHFVTDENVNVGGLILAGNGDLKSELSQSDMFDKRLVAKVIKVVDVDYGGEEGFEQV